jgi:hypothetical protein
MKPFNLQEALAGKPVVTRDGREVTDVTYFSTLRNSTSFKLRGVLEGYLRKFNDAGMYLTNKNLDLFMASTKKTGWVNIYRENITTWPALKLLPGGAVIHPSKAIADKQQETAKERIAVVELTWEE